MFPPIEDAILQNNPKFATLHKTLTTRLLNPDGSSKNLTAADRDATKEVLQAHRIRNTKSEILRSALSSLPLKPQTPPLPPDLLELIILLSLKLSTPTLPAPSLALLTSSDPYSSLHEHIPRISALLSTHLHTQGLALARLLHPSTNSSYLHRSIPKIPSALSTLTADIATQKSSLTSSRLALVPLTTHVLTQYRLATESAIRILETQKHGQVARHAKARSEVASAEARQEEGNAKAAYLMARKMVYTEEASGALREYVRHLRDGRARLVARQKDAERELERYGVGRDGDGGEKEKVMREIARVYGEMGRQMREVRRDMDRLKNA